MIKHKIDTPIYSVIGKDTMANRAAWRVRKKMFDRLAALIPLEKLENILDVGVTSDAKRQESNYFEALYPYKERITALSDQNAAWLEQKYPGLRFVPGDGRSLPFSDGTFDLVFSSAVIEHVGGYENQRTFIRECWRVSKKHVFITTPNRWHPIEMHTALPFLHWLPKPVHRKILTALGMGALADERALNLLDAAVLKKQLTELTISDYTIYTASFCGFPSNLMLHIKK